MTRKNLSEPDAQVLMTDPKPHEICLHRMGGECANLNHKGIYRDDQPFMRFMISAIIGYDEMVRRVERMRQEGYL